MENDHKNRIVESSDNSSGLIPTETQDQTPTSSSSSSSNKFQLDLDKLKEQNRQLVKAYKALSSDFRSFEAIIKQCTPLDSLSDLNVLKHHLEGLAVQKTASNDEINRLTELLKGNRFYFDS